MGGAAAVRGARRRLAAGVLVAAAALLGTLLGASGARAAELIYWENPGEAQVGVANVDGSGASLLNTAGSGLMLPAGMSYDPVAGRLYLASGNDHIVYLNLDGSGGGTMPLPAGTQISGPAGVVVDPVARIAYWLNTDALQPKTISWARLDGSEGGEFPLGGLTLSATERLALDPVAGRLYWGNGDGSFHFAPLIGRAGAAGSLEAKAGGGAPILGLAVDAASEQIFWVELANDTVYMAGLSGEEKSEVVRNVPFAINKPLGLAFDPDLDRLYWANSAVEETAQGALGFAKLGSPPAEITPTGVAVNHPQDVLLIKSPVSTGPPVITVEGRQLSCSQGKWGADFVSSFVYRSPVSYAYQWTLNDVPIAGAEAASFVPTASGRYKCAVTAVNPAGGTSRTSVGLNVTVTSTRPPKPTAGPSPEAVRPASLRLLGKPRHLKARPGRSLALKVRTTNAGTVTSTPVSLCLKLTRKAKRALKPGRCQRIGPLAGGASASAKLRLRVKPDASPGLYQLRITLPASQIKVTLRVLP